MLHRFALAAAALAAFAAGAAAQSPAPSKMPDGLKNLPLPYDLPYDLPGGAEIKNRAALPRLEIYKVVEDGNSVLVAVRNNGDRASPEQTLRVAVTLDGQSKGTFEGVVPPLGVGASRTVCVRTGRLHAGLPGVRLELKTDDTHAAFVSDGTESGFTQADE
jgi:hypothetical protein